MVRIPEIKAAFEKHESRHLRKLSDRILTDGALENKKELIRLSIVTHALSNILEKSYYKKKKSEWERFVKRVDEGLDNLLEGDRGAIEKLETAIVELDESFGRYADNILHRSQVRKGSNLYAWGITLTYAADLVGVEESEILTQSGQTRMVDEEGTTIVAGKRLKHLEEMM
ncbi:MAG: hypothetical protein GOV00_00915 [Candidatus Altiarchaeota archaeon]|nr:hypothetical protein [Candidatus Altiarchaeota archaeon]